MPIEQDIQQWQETAYRLPHDTLRDPLTGVCNRSCFEEALMSEFTRSRRRCTVIGLLLLDLDGLKQVNERLGYAAGDRLLQEVAATLSWNVRDTDVVARHGGDRFCILVADASEAGLQALGERLQQAVANLRVQQDEPTAVVGISIGVVACYPRRGTHSCGQVLSAAEKALYAAKASVTSRITLVSLLAEEDARLLKEVQERLFSQFLVRRGRIAEREAHKVRRPATPFHTIGRLARQLGWLSREESQQLLIEQRQSRHLFGEIAVRRGLLTQEQVYGLLALQREPPQAVRDAVVEQHFLALVQAQEEMQAYYRTVLGVDNARPL